MFSGSIEQEHWPEVAGSEFGNKNSFAKIARHWLKPFVKPFGEFARRIYETYHCISLILHLLLLPLLSFNSTVHITFIFC